MATMNRYSSIIRNHDLLRRTVTKVHVCAKRDLSSFITRSANNDATISSSSSSSSRGLNLWTWYSRMLDTNPIITKCLSAGIITSTGNVLSQGIVHEESDLLSFLYSIDWNQVGRFAVLNMILVTPSLHYWYNFINRAVPGRNAAAVMKRVFYDEFVFTPMYMPIFLSSLWTLEGSKNIPKMLKDEMPNVMMAEWALWVPTMTFTFRFIPVKYQVLLINSVGVIWHTFLSYTAREAHTRSVQASFEGVPAISAEKNEKDQDRKKEQDLSGTNDHIHNKQPQHQPNTTTATQTTGLSRYMSRELQVFLGLAKQ